MNEQITSVGRDGMLTFLVLCLKTKSEWCRAVPLNQLRWWLKQGVKWRTESNFIEPRPEIAFYAKNLGFMPGAHKIWTLHDHQQQLQLQRLSSQITSVVFFGTKHNIWKLGFISSNISPKNQISFDCHNNFFLLFRGAFRIKIRSKLGFCPNRLDPRPLPERWDSPKGKTCLFCILGYSKHIICSWKVPFFWWLVIFMWFLVIFDVTFGWDWRTTAILQQNPNKIAGLLP